MKPSFATRLNRFYDRRPVKIAAWTVAAVVWLPFLFVLLMVLGINPIFTMGVKPLATSAALGRPAAESQLPSMR